MILLLGIALGILALLRWQTEISVQSDGEVILELMKQEGSATSTDASDTTSPAETTDTVP